MKPRSLGRLGGAFLAVAVAGCTSFHPVALPAGPKLAPRLEGLDLQIPDSRAPQGSVMLNPHRALRPAQVALLAAINDPDMVYERARVVTARARLDTKQMLPNPSLGLSYAALVSGPASAGAVTASISQDIQSLITYKARAEASRALVGQLSAKVLWREWQVARQAQLLAVSICLDDRELAIRRRDARMLSSQLAAIRKMAGAGNAALTAEAPIAAAQAAAQQGLATARVARLKHWIALDKLMGLQPSARFAIAPPATPRVPHGLQGQIATLPQRRPDIVALRMAYAASQASVRAAILTQLPPFSFGIAGGSDTSNVVSAGPQITMNLPVFHGAGPGIGLQRATRAEIRKQYRARLDAAVGDVLGLKARFDLNARLVPGARRAADLAASKLALSQKANLTFVNGAFRGLRSIGNLMIATADGNTVPLGRIAKITMGRAPSLLLVNDNGHPAVTFDVYQQDNANSVAIGKEIQARLDRFMTLQPSAIRLSKWYDRARLVGSSIGAMEEAIVLGSSSRPA